MMLLFDGVVNNANSSGVVNVYGSWWLWMTKFFRDKPDTLASCALRKSAPSSASAAEAATSLRIVQVT
jgi:hypothetical protein